MNISKERSDYENKGRNVSTFVVSQPRCGSTLLMRLAAIAGQTGVRGDQPMDFYEALLTLYEVTPDPWSVYGNMVNLERDGKFADTFSGANAETQQRMRNYYIEKMIFPEGGPCRFAKSTMLGFNNNSLRSFTEMLRGLKSDHNDIRILFLTRDHNEIVESMANKNGPGKVLAKENPEIYLDILKRQSEQMEDAAELGDYFLDYSEILDDPMKALMMTNPSHYPLPGSVEAVMKKKIK